MDSPTPAPAERPYVPPLPEYVGAPPPREMATEPHPRPRPRRMAGHRRALLLPLLLFAATCLSTFWAGSQVAIGVQQMREGAGILLVGRWHDGLVYMLSVMGILVAHEAGHFLQALRYRIPASLPFFIPMPLTPLGTMGAVIGMQGSEADRKELFDIGISGPLAGLVVALPMIWIGIKNAVPGVNEIHYQFPLLFKALIAYLHPGLAPGQELAMNPMLMAGWVGLLVTGLNMLPISQLDGGHVSYALFGRRAHWFARAFVLAAIAYIILAGVYGWIVMLLLVMMIGVEHPPTANDRVELGRGRRLLGLASLLIPVFCLAPNPISFGVN